MKKLFIFLVLALLVFLFFSSEAAALACREGIDLFVTRVLPTLLPFLIAGGTLSRLGMANTLANFFAKPFSFLFRLPGESAFVFFSGMLCGNPIAAQLASDLHQQQVLDTRQTIRTAALSSFVSPAFLIGTVATNILQDTASVLPLCAGHYFGAIAAGLLFSLPDRKNAYEKQSVHVAAPHISPMAALMQSVSSAAQVLPKICVCIAFFSVLHASLVEFGFFSILQAIADKCSWNAPLIQAMFTSILELTGGCVAIGSLSVVQALQYACMSAALSFGGLSVLCQNASFLSQHNIHMGYFLFFRLVHAILSFAITYVFCMI